MNGKLLKVVQYNLEFGSKERFVNVFSCFKHKPTSNLYLIYADVDTKYNIIYYGSAHIKEDSILSMQCRNQKEEEIIKEYIFKVTNQEAIDDFEVIPLDKVEKIEIIASNKFEVKPEVIASLVEMTLPKKDVSKEEKSSKQKKRKSKKGLVFLLLAVILIGIGGYYYFSTLPSKNMVAKQIICEKEYSHNDLKATVFETNTYNFNNQDILEKVDTTMIYQFEESDYQEFIMKGTYYKYMPDSNTEGGWDKDDTSYTFKVMIKEEIDSSYNKPTAYEEVLSYYKKEGYTCKEDIK